MTSTGDELTDRFLAYLTHHAYGESSAKRAVTICFALGLETGETQRRMLRACAQHAVDCGHLVCAGQRGYFVPASKAEADKATGRLRSEAGELLGRADKADRLARARFSAGGPPLPTERGLFALLEAS